MFKKGLSIIIVILLLNGCVGEYTDTIEKAIENEAERGTIIQIEELDKDTALVIMEEPENLVKMSTVFKGENGWEVSDNSGVLGVLESTEGWGFGGMKAPLTVMPNKTINFQLGLVIDKKIEKITIFNTETKEEFPVKTITSKSGMKIYYAYDERSFNFTTLKAYSKDGKVLYEK